MDLYVNNNTNNENLDYGIVELVGEKGNADSIERGLFRGVENEMASGDQFLWIVTKQDVARAFNLKHFTILSIEVSDGPTRIFTFFMADANDQKMARDLALSVFEKLKRIALPNNDEKGLLDVTLFKNVPMNYDTITPKPSVTKPIHLPIPNTLGDTSGIYRCPTRTVSGFVETTAKEPEPCVLKRKTKRPTESALKKMCDKLDLIAKGEFQSKLPAIKSEVEESKTKITSENSVFNDYAGTPFED